MADQSPVIGRPRRSSRHVVNHNISSHSSSSSSLYAPFPKFHLGDGSASPSPTPSGSRLRYGENWLQENPLEEQATRVSPLLLIPSLPKGRFVQAWKLAPNALANVIARLHGSYELLGFCHVSKEMGTSVESLFEENEAVRDAFLSRIIRVYEPSVTWLNKGIKIDLPDTELLLESESVSLAAYPTHALRVITPHASHSSSESSTGTDEIENTTSRFQTLTLTHSRFIAYLRNRTAPQALQLASQDEDDVLSSTPDSDGLPELIFPSPLFYFKDVEPPVIPAYLPLPVSSPNDTGSKSRRSTKSASDIPRLGKSKSVSSFGARDIEDAQSMKGSVRKKRLSLKPKRKSGVAPPPPSSMPPMPNIAVPNMTMPNVGSMGTFGADQFGSLGRTSGQFGNPTMGHGRSRSQSAVGPPSTSWFTPPPSFSQSSYGGFTPPGSGQFTPPGSRPSTGYGGSTPPSLANRRGNVPSFHMPERTGSSGQLMPSRSMPFLNSPGTQTPTSGGGPPTAITGYDTPGPQTGGGMGDIHSLSQVFRLTRAPIFRVFVPCSQLNDTVLKMCMAQLHAAALIPHLRAGDLVCNLGYVPDAMEGTESVESRGWMVFSGHDLRALSTKIPIPVRDPTFVLNTPHYYSHILSAGENPRFELVIPLCPPERSHVPAFSLVRVVSSVTTPLKNGGDLGNRKHKISRFIWVARVECARWGTEWLIEAEGTKEGRAYIEHALEDSRNGVERVWELVRDKTGRGRVYIKKP